MDVVLVKLKKNEDKSFKKKKHFVICFTLKYFFLHVICVTSLKTQLKNDSGG